MKISNLDPARPPEWKETYVPEGPTDGPYLYERVSFVRAKWNKNYDQEAACMCDHVYYRHFDSYDDNHPIGCKYCDCYHFVLKE